MALIVKDRVKQSAAAPGTGTITLGSTPTGFQSFAAVGNANTTYFAIVDPISGDWEVNYGVYTSSGTTLTRNATPLSSSNSGSLVNFTGAVDVFVTYPSEKAVYEDTAGVVTFTDNPILSAGTANGVTYLNGSKVLTSGSALVFDSSDRLIVGAGSASIGHRIESVAVSNGASIAIRGRASDTFGYLSWHGNTGATEYARIGSDSTSSLFFGIGSSGATALTLNSTTLYTASGINVGIGTSSANKLTVKPSASSSATFDVLTGSTNSDSIRLSSGGTVNTWLEMRGYLGVKLYSDTTNTVTVDSAGNLGLGVTPSAWLSGTQALQIGSGSAIWNPGSATQTWVMANTYYDQTDTRFEFIGSGTAGAYAIIGNTHQWNISTGTTGANNPTTFTQAMTLDASSNLMVGGTSVYAATITSYASSTRSGGLGIRNSAGTAAGGIYTGAAGSGAGSTDVYVEGAGVLGFLASGSERGRFNSDGLTVNGKITINGLQAVAAKSYGYGGGYSAIQIGLPNSVSGNVALAVDVSTVAGSAFTGSSQVILPSNGTLFVNAAGTNFIGAIARDSSNRILLGPSLTGGITQGDVVINTSGNVGIGTNNPAANLHISRTTAASVMISNTSTSLVTDDPMGVIDFSAGTANTVNARVSGLVVGTSEAGGTLSFETRVDGGSLSEKMRLTSYGNLLFNTADNGSRIHVLQNNTVTGAIAITGTTWVGIDFFNSNADANARNWKMATTYTSFGMFELLSSSTQGGTDYATCLSLSRGSSLALQGALPQTGTGITFPATQSASSNANTLDDYEEGFFTATTVPSTAGTITLNSGIDKLAYTKIGRVVYVQGLLEISSVSSPVGAVVYIQGLPFTTADLDEYAGRGGTAFPVKEAARGVYIFEGQTQIEVQIDASTLVSGNQFYVSFNYIAA